MKPSAKTQGVAYGTRIRKDTAQRRRITMEATQINQALNILSKHVSPAPTELVEKMVRTVRTMNQQRALEEKTTERSPTESAAAAKQTHANHLKQHL